MPLYVLEATFQQIVPRLLLPRVRVEVTPGDRFACMIETLFGLARLGRADAKGMPHPSQLALFAWEFSDVIVLRSMIWMLDILKIGREFALEGLPLPRLPAGRGGWRVQIVSCVLGWRTVLARRN